MTQVTGVLSRQHAAIEIVGHAGVRDICNAASTLTFALAENLRREAGSRFVFAEKDGMATLDLDSPSERERLMIEAFLCGFEMLAYNFEEHLALDIREV